MNILFARKGELILSFIILLFLSPNLTAQSNSQIRGWNAAQKVHKRINALRKSVGSEFNTFRATESGYTGVGSSTDYLTGRRYSGRSYGIEIQIALTFLGGEPKGQGSSLYYPVKLTEAKGGTATQFCDQNKRTYDMKLYVRYDLQYDSKTVKIKAYLDEGRHPYTCTANSVCKYPEKKYQDNINSMCSRLNKNYTNLKNRLKNKFLSQVSLNEEDILGTSQKVNYSEFMDAFKRKMANRDLDISVLKNEYERKKRVEKGQYISKLVKADIAEINKAINNNESNKAINLIRSLIRQSERNEDIKEYLDRNGYNLQNEITKINNRKSDLQKKSKEYLKKADALLKKGDFYEARRNYILAKDYNESLPTKLGMIDYGLRKVEAILKYNEFLEEYPLHLVYEKRPADKSTNSNYTRANPGSTRDIRRMLDNITERAQDDEKVSYMASLGKANGYMITFEKSDTEFPLLSNVDSGGTSTDNLLSLDWLDSSFPSKPVVMIYNEFLKKWFILSEIMYNPDEPESAQFEKAKKEFKIVISDNWYKLKDEYKKWQRQGFGTIKSIDYVEGRFVALLNKGDDYYLFERFLRPDTVDREFNRTKKYMTFFHTLTNDNEAVYLHQTLDDNYLAKKYRSFDEFYIDFKEMKKTYSVYSLQYGK